MKPSIRASVTSRTTSVFWAERKKKTNVGHAIEAERSTRPLCSATKTAGNAGFSMARFALRCTKTGFSKAERVGWRQSGNLCSMHSTWKFMQTPSSRPKVRHFNTMNLERARTVATLSATTTTAVHQKANRHCKIRGHRVELFSKPDNRWSNIVSVQIFFHEQMTNSRKPQCFLKTLDIKKDHLTRPTPINKNKKKGV